MRQSIVEMIEQHLDEEGISLFDGFLKMLEDAFPFADVYYRMAKSEANVTENSMESDTVYSIADSMIQQVCDMGGDVNLFIENMDKMDFFIKYPDVVRKIKEVYGND